jgi:hypothetical protein
VNVDLKNNNESLVQFRLKGENSIEGNVTVLKSNNGDVGAVYKLKGMKVE